MVDDTQLVESLLQRGMIDQETLREGMDRTKSSGSTLYETLIYGRLMEEESLVGLVSEMIDIPHADVDTAKISSDVRDLVPGSMARRNRAIPLSVSDDILELGMVDPVDLLATEEISTHTGKRVRPVLVGPSSIEDALDSLYGPGLGSAVDDVFSSFDDLELGSMMDEVLAGDNWSEMFEDEPSVEDSAVLSRELRDRPSTDVLNDEDLGDPNDLDDESDPEEEEEERAADGDDSLFGVRPRPIAPYALDKWDVDDAIDSGDSQILSAASAQQLYGNSSGSALLRETVEAKSIVKQTLRAAEEHDDDDDDDDEGSSKTSVGFGLGGFPADESSAAETEDEDEDEGHTSMGVGPMALSAGAKAKRSAHVEPDDEHDDEGTSIGVGSRDPDTDYGRLGLSFLQSEAESSAAPADDYDDESSPQDDERPEKTEILGVRSFEEDRRKMSSETTRSAGAPMLTELPDGVELRGLTLAMANIMIQRGLISKDELLELAQAFARK